jgi:tetratricopeptide (TPR) repeat protein
LGDRFGIATNLANLGVVARKQRNFETAREYFDRCVQKYIEIGATRRSLRALNHLISACETLDRTDEAGQYCELALELIEESEIQELESEAVRYRARRILFSDGDPPE